MVSGDETCVVSEPALGVKAVVAQLWLNLQHLSPFEEMHWHLNDTYVRAWAGCQGFLGCGLCLVNCNACSAHARCRTLYAGCGRWAFRYVCVAEASRFHSSLHSLKGSPMKTNCTVPRGPAMERTPGVRKTERMAS
jgi:hypothetical protein